MTDATNLGDLAAAADLAAPALIDLRMPGAPRTLTHGEMEAAANGIAASLVARGLPPSSSVAILSGNRWEYVAAYFGIMRAGFVAVPVNVRLPADTIAFVLDTAKAVLAYVDAAHAGLLPAGMPFVDFDTAIVPADHFATVPPAPDGVAQILFTSGSTGRPKGVPLSHAGQLWALRQSRARALPGPPARGIVVQPLFHMNGLFLTKATFAAGGSLVMLPSYEARSYLQAIADWGVTAITCVPTMLARALKEADLVASLDLTRVTSIRVGSAPVTQSLLDRIAAVFPNATIANGYGTTEAGPFAFGPHPAGLPTPPLSVGAELPEGEIELVPRPGTADGPDQGVLRMRNPAVMSGYLNLPDATAKVLQDGWYYSGDVFRREPDGFYYFVSRADDMFVCSGENIFPSDVERMLERSPAIHQACVVPLPDDERGQMPVAFVVPSSGAAPTAAEVKTFALANGPAYAHPRRVAFVPDLPWAGTNKLDRAGLIARARALEAAGGWAG